MLNFEAHIQRSALGSYLLLEIVIVLKLSEKAKVRGRGREQQFFRVCKGGNIKSEIFQRGEP